MARLKEALDESNLSIRVDVVDWATTSEVFQKIIAQDKVVVQQAPQSQATSSSYGSVC